MTLYIDVTRLSEWRGRYTGMERFAFEITKYLLQDKKVNARLCIFSNKSGFVELNREQYRIKEGRLETATLKPSQSLRRLLPNNPIGVAAELRRRIQGSGSFNKLNTISLSKENTLLIYDGLWDKENYIRAVEAAVDGGVQLAHVVHDLVPIVAPHVCFEFVSLAFTNYFKKISPKIDTLITISHNTEKDFLGHFGNFVKPSLNKVVTRHGEDFGVNVARKPKDVVITGQDFILCVGTIETRKNHQLLYQAYRLAAIENIELPKLVIVGREGWMSEQVIRAIQKDPLVNNKFILAGPVNDSELSWLYKNCLFTVFPAVYEGWGLPVAESLYYGKICAASNSSSIPEIGGDINVYYSPYDARACLDVLSSLRMPSYRKKLENKLLNNYKTTMWCETALAIADACKI